VKAAVRNVYGELGEAAMRAHLVEYNEVRRRGIIRVRGPYKDHVLAVLGLIRNTGNKRVLIAPIAVTGSLKRARKLVEA
ncbi:MAG: Rpp14/Pop5 family protein, partial [Acidilobaceae archaeon]